MKLKVNKNIFIIVIIAIVLLTCLKFTVIDNFIKKDDTENLTIKLKDDNDFLEWFNEFNNLYKDMKGKNYPDFFVKKEMFESIKDLLEEKESSTYYKDGKYFVSDNETLELDVNTRSFRYTKYKEKKVVEIMEARLINGRYYIQMVDSNYIYRITFNKDGIDKVTYKNDKEVYIGESIYQSKEFKW